MLAPEPVGTSPYKIIPDPLVAQTNPLYTQLLGEYNSSRRRTLANLNVSYRMFSWLSVDASGGYDRGPRQDVGVTPSGLTAADGINTTKKLLAVRDDSTNGLQFQGGITGTKVSGQLTGILAVREEA